MKCTSTRAKLTTMRDLRRLHPSFSYNQSYPKCRVEGAVLNGFADVFGGDGAGDFQDAVVGAGADDFSPRIGAGPYT
jgi:hypothetical protein